VTCERVLEENETFYAALVERAGALERLDYDEEHWAGPPEGAFCHWRSRVPVKQQKQRVAVDNETLTELFRRLGEADFAGQKQFRFVLALWLMRKKVLRCEQTVLQNHLELWEMRLVSEDNVYRVERVALTDAELESVNEQLRSLLEGGPVNLGEPQEAAVTEDEEGA
jgi:hypothetical protein